MIPNYTRRDLSMHHCGPHYFLPFENTLSKEEVFEKTIQLFTESHIYERELYTDRISTPSITHEKNEIRVKCFYEGYDEFYPFTISAEVFQLNDEKKKYDGAYMISMRMEHEYQGLLDELLDDKVVPRIISTLRLKEYSCLDY